MKHGDYGNRLYWVWHSMKNRCYNLKNKDFKYYGGKGISVCPQWFEYKIFMDWTNSHGYKQGLTIHRVDPELDYAPENCRWVTHRQNCGTAAIKHERTMSESISVRLPNNYRIKIFDFAKNEAEKTKCKTNISDVVVSAITKMFPELIK